MPATRYKIWAVGGPVGKGATKSLYVGVTGIAKANSAELPYTIVNELICNQLARSIMLPVPPGFVIEHENNPYFVSLDFNLGGEDLPPADTSALAQSQPGIATGIILFDIWILNDDRHPSNLAFDTTSNKVQVFDHSHAFLRAEANPRNRFDRAENNLGIGNHCLLRELTSFVDIHDWHNRIIQVPEYYIRNSIESAVDLGLPPNLVDYCFDYLLERRVRLIDLVRNHKGLFGNVQPQIWDELDTDGGIE